MPVTPEDEELLERLKGHFAALDGVAREIAESEATRAAVANAAALVFQAIRPVLVAVAGAGNPVAGIVVDRVSAAFATELHKRAGAAPVDSPQAGGKD